MMGQSAEHGAWHGVGTRYSWNEGMWHGPHVPPASSYTLYTFICYSLNYIPSSSLSVDMLTPSTSEINGICRKIL